MSLKYPATSYGQKKKWLLRLMKNKSIKNVITWYMNRNIKRMMKFDKLLKSVGYHYNNDEFSFSKPYSERTAELIDEEVKRMINEQYERAKKVLTEQKEGHNQLAQLLIEKEVIFAEDVERIFGKRPWASRSEEIMNQKEQKILPEENKSEETPLLENKEA